MKIWSGPRDWPPVEWPERCSSLLRRRRPAHSISAVRPSAKGHYLVVMYFDSAETRAWYFPVEGEGLSEEGRKEINASEFGEAFDKFWDFADAEWRGDGLVIS